MLAGQERMMADDDKRMNREHDKRHERERQQDDKGRHAVQAALQGAAAETIQRFGAAAKEHWWRIPGWIMKLTST